MKVQTDPKEWDRMLKYCLLAYRATPHSATGFSPYELIHSRNLRGPLEAMRSGWLENQITYSGTVEWVAELRENLTTLPNRLTKKRKSTNKNLNRPLIRAPNQGVMNLGTWYSVTPQG